jgi:hypothetical protein
METLRKYRRLAKECDELAKKAIAPEHRSTILQVAAVWRSLAEEREKMIQASSYAAFRARCDGHHARG